jgi:hypothetical protein
MEYKISYPPLSAFGQFWAHFSPKLNKKYKIRLYWPLAHLELILQKKLNKEYKIPFIGLWPIWGSFYKKN